MEFNLELKVGLSEAYLIPRGLEELVISGESSHADCSMSRMLCSLASTTTYSGGFAPVRRSRATWRCSLSPRAPEGDPRAGSSGWQAEAINPHCFLVDEERVRAKPTHRESRRLSLYTANEVPEEMTRLLDCGVDGLITNYPARLRAK